MENILEHAAVLADGNEITEKDLPDFMLRNRIMIEAPQHTTPVENVNEHIQSLSPNMLISLHEHEREYIKMVLHRLHYNYSDTARKLGVSRSTLWRKIKEYGLSPE